MDKTQALEAISQLIAGSQADAHNGKQEFVTGELLARAKEAYAFFRQDHKEQHQSDKR